MGRLTIRDNALWVKHIEGGPEIVERIRALPPDAPISLIVENRLIRFRKMRNGSDGRPTDGLRPEPEFKPFWDALQERRGEVVPVRLGDQVQSVEAYLASLTPLLSEWTSPEDSEAYDEL